ncbi:hypothetical protein [Fulvivirga kasyanovii]|uniref:hypothetical protein n=1 Tax=Fulvivirga kasyanovii TaxID=396812 RepID=UPI0012BB508A|nr:hypothetical protein [Fulvivirga kasyanovii]
MKVFRTFLLAAVTFCSLAMYSCSDPYDEITLQGEEPVTDPHSNGEGSHRD